MKILNTILVLALAPFFGCTTVSKQKTVAVGLERSQIYSVGESSHSLFFGFKTGQSRKAHAQNTELEFFVDEIESRSDLIFSYENPEYRKKKVNFEIDGEFEWREVVERALSVNGFVLEEMPDKTFIIKKTRTGEGGSPVI